MPVIRVEPTSSQDSGPCECCGSITRRASGLIYSNNSPRASYFVRWAVGRLEHDVNLDFVIGKWGEGTSQADRSLVSLTCRFFETGPQFMVIDASPQSPALGGLASVLLRRDQIINTPLAGEIFEMVDAIWMHDENLRELTRRK